ncbi:MAG: 50S ribosomal protein L29 [Bacilli bacterium]|nr:50S ribosomal protein L29 [Bacilli bacterium]
MKMVEIRKLATEDLNKKLEEIKKELFNLKFSAATGNLEKPHRIKELRHEVAKIKTVIRERELNEGKEEAK